MKHASLAQLLMASHGGPMPQALVAPGVFERLATDRAWIASLAGRDDEVYGVNRRPGHRDGESVAQGGAAELQRHILESHLVPPLDASQYNKHEAHCIGLAKAFAVSLGGTGMTPGLYRHLLGSLEDPAFQPTIPCAQSYSSGDVIPAAHWAQALLNWRSYTARAAIEPGEAMALVNGHFVHVGLAASAFPALRACGERLAQAFAAIAVAVRIPPATLRRPPCTPGDAVAPLLEHVIAAVEAAGHTRPTRVQVPVSIRAVPEVLISFAGAVDGLAQQVDTALRGQSGNPLFEPELQQVRSQGSFLAASVSIAQSALVEAMLLAGWALVGQVQYLLSGEVQGVAVDAGRPDDSLGMIQVPKAMMATLEHLRLSCGRRAFAAGAATSHGVEDLWTHGEALSRQVMMMAESLAALATRASAVCEVATHAPDSGRAISSGQGAITPSSSMRRLHEVERQLDARASTLAFLDWCPWPAPRGSASVAA